MYFSKIDFRTEGLSVLRLLNSPYRIHAAIEGSFSSGALRECENGRVLWRMEQMDDGIARIYLVSPQPPDTNDFAGMGLTWETKDYQPFLNNISEGSIWQFRLKANPTRKALKDKGRRKNDRIVNSVQGHVTEGFQRQWLFDRSEAHGFRIVEECDGDFALRISNRSKETFSRAKSTVTLVTAQYDGLLEIVDADAFRRTLGFGLGRAKGFGCGLLTIMPPAYRIDLG